MAVRRTSTRKENAMKKRKPLPENPYATLRGGKIEAPKDTAKEQPKSTVLRGDSDLRNKK